MANSLSVIDMVTKESLRIAHEKATFIGTCMRQYDDSFAKTGAKIGTTLRIRNPNQFTRRKNSRVMDVQDQAETTQTVTLATQDGVDMRFNSAELSLSVDELSARYIEPATSVMMGGIDGDMIKTATQATHKVTGTAGTVVGASGDMSAIYLARGKLNQGLAPKDGQRYIQMDSTTMATVVNGNKAIFQPSDQLAEAFREGFYSRSAMADWYENERTYIQTNGSDVTGTLDATPLATDGGTTLDMHSTIATSAQTVGEIFTIAGVYDCHPETKLSTGSLKQFTIVATDSPATNQTTIYPPTYWTGAKQNVCTSTSAQVTLATFQSTPALTFYGAASTSYRQNLMYHKEAFVFVTGDLPLMADAAKCVRQEQDGFSLRVWQGSDIRNDELLMRIDMLYGFLAVRPAWACRISN